MKLFAYLFVLLPTLCFAGSESWLQVLKEWDDTFIIIMRHGVRLDHTFASNGEKTYDDWEKHASQNNFEPWNSPLAPPESQTYLEDSIAQIIKEGLIPDIIITSPYERAIQTAKLLRDKLKQVGHNVKIMGDLRLQEWAYATFGRLGKEIPTAFPWSLEELNDELTEESELNYLQRVKAVILEHASKHKKVIIVGHQHTVASIFPFATNFKEVVQGGYAFGTYVPKARFIIPDITRSRGLHFREQNNNQTAAAAQVQ